MGAGRGMDSGFADASACGPGPAVSPMHAAKVLKRLGQAGQLQPLGLNIVRRALLGQCHG